MAVLGMLKYFSTAVVLLTALPSPGSAVAQSTFKIDVQAPPTTFATVIRRGHAVNPPSPDEGIIWPSIPSDGECDGGPVGLMECMFGRVSTTTPSNNVSTVFVIPGSTVTVTPTESKLTPATTVPLSTIFVTVTQPATGTPTGKLSTWITSAFVNETVTWTETATINGAAKAPATLS